VQSSTALQASSPERIFASPGGIAVTKSFAGIPPLAPEEKNPPVLSARHGPELWIQRKLAIGAVNDPLEAEADAMAERVMRGQNASAQRSAPAAVNRKCSCDGSGKSCPACDEEKKKLQRKAVDASGPMEAPAIVHDALRSPGQPLDSATRAFFEPRFGYDFSHVRLHTDKEAAAAAAAVNARAFTVGRDIAFASGEYTPGWEQGLSLLAHELCHVIQQSAAGPERIAKDTAAEIQHLPPRTTTPPGPTGSNTIVQRQPQAEPQDPDLAKALRAATKAKNARGVQAMISASETIYRLLEAYMPNYANVISSVGYSESGKSVAARKSGTKGVNIDVTVTKEFIERLDQSTVGMMMIELRSALKNTGVSPSPPDSPVRRGLLESIHLEQQAQQARNDHEAQQKHVADLFAAAKAVPREQSTPFAVLQNSIEWIEKKGFKLAILTPTHDFDRRKDGMVAYFDSRTTYPDIGGTYDPTQMSDEGVEYRRSVTLGEAPPVLASSRGGSLQYFTVPLFLPRTPVRMEDLSGTLVHETQHIAQRIEATVIPNLAGVQRRYLSEFNAYWVQRPLEEQEVLPGGLYVDKSRLERRTEMPGVTPPVYGQHFGSETNKATNFTLEGKSVKKEQKAECKRVLECDLETKNQTTNFKNEKQQKIFEQLINGYPEDLFACFYICNGDFKNMVDKLTGAVGVNLVNSIRIEAVLEAADRCPMTKGDQCSDQVMAAVSVLDDVDKEFLRNSLQAFPAELKEETKRVAEEEQRERKRALSSLSGTASSEKAEKPSGPASFWLYLSRILPPAVFKKVQQAIQSTAKSPKKP
jgi:hypothetical protein